MRFIIGYAKGKFTNNLCVSLQFIEDLFDVICWYTLD